MQKLTTPNTQQQDSMRQQNLIQQGRTNRDDSLDRPPPLLVCPECDLMINPSIHKSTGRCPRCRGHLPAVPSPKQAESSRRLAWWLAFTGLLLAIPALSLPLATLKLAGMERHCTLLSGVEILWQQDHILVASLVFLTSVLAPILLLITTAILTTLLSFHSRAYFRSPAKWTRYLLRLYEHATQWGMLDVYLLSLLVAYIKLIDYGNVTLGLGLMCYILVMVMNFVILRQFTSHTAWQLWRHSP